MTARRRRETPRERRQRLREQAREERRELRRINRRGFFHHLAEIAADVTRRR